MSNQIKIGTIISYVEEGKKYYFVALKMSNRFTIVLSYSGKISKYNTEFFIQDIDDGTARIE